MLLEGIGALLGADSESCDLVVGNCLCHIQWHFFIDGKSLSALMSTGSSVAVKVDLVPRGLRLPVRCLA